MGFEDESCIYAKVSGSVVVFLILYVDDILLIGNNIPLLQSVKDWLQKYFDVKDLGDAAYILGIKIYRDRSKRLIGLSQDTYLDKILKRFKMEYSKKGHLPLHHGIKIRSIMYAMTCTRPDLSFALSMVSRHQKNPGECHWTAVKNILKYLRNTKDKFLVYGGEEELRVTGYYDASWQIDKDDSRLQYG
ncbi:retrotransposon protein, putative, ty1-copia subclass [Tanacetum coccineum]